MIQHVAVKPSKEQQDFFDFEEEYFKKHTLVFNTLFLPIITKIIKELLSKHSDKKTLSIDKGILTFNHNNYTISTNTDSQISNNKEVLTLNKEINQRFMIFKKDTEKYLFSNLEKLNGNIIFYADDLITLKNEDMTQVEIHIKKLDEAKETVITIPSSAQEKCKIVVPNTVAMQLKKYKSLAKKYPYILYIDKKTYTIMAIGIQDKNEYTQFFNDDIINIDVTDREYEVMTVEELFPLKTKEDVELSIYKSSSNLYVKTLTEVNSMNISCINKTHLQEYSDKLEPRTSNKLKLQSINQTWSATTTLNKFKFTVHTDDKEFLTQIVTFLKELNLIQSKSSPKIQSYTFALENNKKDNLPTSDFLNSKMYNINIEEDFLHLKITNSSDYTFTFLGLSSSYAYPCYFKHIQKVTQDILQRKTSVIQRVTSFLKDKDLYSNTKIKSVGFKTIFRDKSLFNKTTLIKLNTGSKADTYTLYDYKKATDVYTTSTYYKAYLKQYKEIITLWQKNNKEDTLATREIGELNDDEIIQILKSAINKKIKHSMEVEIIQETKTLFYIKINGEQSVKTPKPIKIGKGITITFEVHIDNKANYFKISHTKKATNKQYDLVLVEQLSYEYEINKWDTKSKKTLDEDSSIKYLTLNDTLDTIVDNVTTFSKKYKLVAISNTELHNEIIALNFSTKKKLEDRLHQNSEVVDFMELERVNIEKAIQSII